MEPLFARVLMMLINITTTMDRKEKISFLKGLQRRDPQAVQLLKELREERAKEEEYGPKIDFDTAFKRALVSGASWKYPLVPEDYDNIANHFNLIGLKKINVQDIDDPTLDKFCQLLEEMWPDHPDFGDY
jgi:hypothetical protein